MKKLDFLLPVLFYLISLCGCSKDNYKPESIINTMFEKNGIDNVFTIWSETYNGNDRLYHGVRNGKDWYALFEENSSKLISEWYGEPMNNVVYGVLPGSAFFSKYNEGYISWSTIFKTDKLLNYHIVYLKKDGIIDYLNIKEVAIEDNVIPNGFVPGKGWICYDDKIKNNFVYDINGNNVLYKSVSETYLDSLQIFSGFDKEKLWISIYNKNGENIIDTTINDNFARERKFHLGYGEYKNFHIDKIYFGNYLKMKWGLTLIPNYYNIDNNEYIVSDLILINEGKLIYKPLDLYNEQNNFDIEQWYDNSILINDKYVISNNGDILYEGNFNSTEDNSDIISYTDWLNVYSSSITRNNYKTGAVWFVRLKIEDKYSHDSKYTFSVTDKSNDIWTYHCDIINFDGSKYQESFKVNIETGEITYL